MGTVKWQGHAAAEGNGRGAQPEEAAARPSEDDFRPENGIFFVVY